VLRAIAHQSANTRPLGVEPGWFFDVSETDVSPAAELRRAIWREFHRRRLAVPVTVRWYDGLRLRLFLGNDLSKPLYIGGSFEPNEFAALAAELGPGKTFVDIGANEGVYTVFAAQRVGSAGRVVAIEPSGKVVERLHANLRLNRLRNVTVVEAAIGDINGEVELAVAGYSHEGQNTVGPVVANPKVETAGHERVAVRRLDDVVAELSLERVDVIKIDAEGSEVRVLAGAGEVIRRHAPLVQLEVASEALEAQGATAADLLEAIEGLGLGLWTFDARTGRLRPGDGSSAVAGNVVAAPTGWRPG
jgi:FkbM family methyltransferase